MVQNFSRPINFASLLHMNNKDQYSHNNNEYTDFIEDDKY